MSDTDRLADGLEAAERFRVAFRHAPIGMAIVGTDGTFQQVNPALCDILGLAESALLGINRDELTHPDDRPLNHHLARQLLAGEIESFTMEKRYRHAHGHYVWIDLAVSLVRDMESGEPKYFVAQVQDVSERKRNEVELRFVADHDWLTGLPNRRSLQVALGELVSSARAGGRRGTLLVLDIDDFKYVNDTLGHQAGDRVVTHVGSILRSRLTRGEFLARLGGDEFAILLTDVGAVDALDVAKEILETVRVSRPITEARAHRLTVSIGIAEIDGSQQSSDEVLRQADVAMYAAKESGRDRASVWVAGDPLQQRLVDRMGWVRRLEDALFNGGFELFAQPIKTLATGEIRRHELLLRLRDDDGGLVLPATFLDTAERFELVQQIDHWVVTEAMRLLDDPGFTGSFAVNLSGRSIGDDRLVALLARSAAAIPGGPGRLTFEITETSAVSDLVVAREFTKDLHDMGFGVALDDFGAGFGSFAYLKHLHFDLLKIDGDFVRGCPTNPTDRLIVGALVDIARGMNKETVAEFTESVETIDCMDGLGVDHCQGHGVGVPVPVASVRVAAPAVLDTA